MAEGDRTPDQPRPLTEQQLRFVENVRAAARVVVDYISGHAEIVAALTGLSFDEARVAIVCHGLEGALNLYYRPSEIEW